MVAAKYYKKKRKDVRSLLCFMNKLYEKMNEFSIFVLFILRLILVFSQLISLTISLN